MLNLLAATVATCVIVYPSDHVSKVEIRNHEFAHCHGWEHKPDARYTKFKRAAQAPAELIRKPYPGKLWIVTKPTAEVYFMCDGHLGCQWFECEAGMVLTDDNKHCRKPD